jgi:hypothetical protein
MFGIAKDLQKAGISAEEINTRFENLFISDFIWVFEDMADGRLLAKGKFTNKDQGEARKEVEVRCKEVGP